VSKEERNRPADGAVPSFEAYAGSGPENYEKYFVPVIGAPLATDLVQAAELQVGERVLDVACGTGVVTRLAAERVGPTGTVAALDINPGMLAVARTVTPASMAIGWHEASVEKSGLPDEAYDVVLCQMGLQFCSDKAAALREMRRLLAPAGHVAQRWSVTSSASGRSSPTTVPYSWR
jgi:ubiquinone/menaquinone biosynthesis C-methylase UbiE